MIPFNKFQAGKRVVLFSYGSGSTATMFSLKLSEGQHPFSLSDIVSVMNVAEKLNSRHEVILHFLSDSSISGIMCVFRIRTHITKKEKAFAYAYLNLSSVIVPGIKLAQKDSQLELSFISISLTHTT